MIDNVLGPDFWTTEKMNPQIYRSSWDKRFQEFSPREVITHLTVEEYRALYLEVFKITAPSAPQRILDYGCGTGLLLPVVQELWPEAGYEGADISPAMVRHCARYAGKYVFWLVPEALPDMAMGEPFDFIVCHSVLTHITLEDGKELLKTLHSLLAPGGWASISVVHNPEIDGAGGNWGEATYGLEIFRRMLSEAGFVVRGWIYSPVVRQTFYGVVRA